MELWTLFQYASIRFLKVGFIMFAKDRGKELISDGKVKVFTGVEQGAGWNMSFRVNMEDLSHEVR